MTGDSNMITESILSQIRYAVCAVGYLKIPAEEFVNDPSAAQYEIVGTGFLVRENTIITNRHVLEDLNDSCISSGFGAERKLLQFVYPRAGGWQTGFCRVVSAGYITNQEIDVGFIEFNRRREPEFQQCRPVALTNDAQGINVGRPIGIFGYPEGTDLLVNGLVDAERIYRFGPVLQQGYISAVAPYDGTLPISEILSDIRTIGGMSGSPVFFADSGEVFAIHFASNQSTTAFSIPVHQPQLFDWLRLHDDQIG
jgi:hypothetical protein